MQPITLTTQLTQKDFLQFANRSNTFMMVFRWMLRIIGAFLLLSVPLQYLSPVTEDLPFPFVQLLVGLVMVGFPVLLNHSNKRNFRNNSSIHGPMTYRFTRSGFEVTGEMFSFHTNWGKVQKISQTKHLIIIWTAPQQAYILPKRDISTEEQATLFSFAGKG